MCARRGELAVALRAGFDPARIGYHGNNKSEAELRTAVQVGVGRIIVDSFHEIERLSRVVSTGSTTERARPRSGRSSHGAGDRRRRGAHPRIHRDRP